MSPSDYDSNAEKNTAEADNLSSFRPELIEKPSPVLFKYYLLTSLLTGPFSPLVFLPLWFRYSTLRYRFDDAGVSMQWGVFFRKEVYLTYRRIQDIHLTRNVLERWMGLAKISLQTASGSSQAEMCIEGVLEADALRDYLYSQMRGAKDKPTNEIKMEADAASDRATVALEGIRDALQLLVDRKTSGGAL